MRGARALQRVVPHAVVGALALACSPAPAPARPVLVFAAADLREALPEIAAAYRTSGGDSVVLTFGATGDLGVQIANGAPADVFFAADQDALARLDAQHGIVDATWRSYAVGRLALVGARAAAPLQLTDLAGPGVRTIAIADPARAPYGRAAREALTRSGLWERVHAKVVYAPNVTQAFRIVQAGNADAGLVARSAVAGAAPMSYALVDTTLYDAIVQAAAVVASSTQPDRAGRFLAYATGSPGRAVLSRYGFGPPPLGVVRPASP